MKLDFLKILRALGSWSQKFLWFLGLRAFYVILILIFIDLILGIAVFYKYIFWAENQKSNPPEKIIKFDEKTYQKVLKQLKSKNQ